VAVRPKSARQALRDSVIRILTFRCAFQSDKFDKAVCATYSFDVSVDDAGAKHMEII
jgi:hypothetical protein